MVAITRTQRNKSRTCPNLTSFLQSNQKKGATGEWKRRWSTRRRGETFLSTFPPKFFLHFLAAPFNSASLWLNEPMKEGLCHQNLPSLEKWKRDYSFIVLLISACEDERCSKCDIDPDYCENCRSPFALLIKESGNDSSSSCVFECPVGYRKIFDYESRIRHCDKIERVKTTSAPEPG